MPDPATVAVAGLFALAALIPLCRRALLRPLTWAMLASGAATWFLAREAPTIVWDEALGPMLGLGGTPGLILRTMVASGVGEILKATAPLAAVSLAPTDAPTGLAYGAAAGAGFGIAGALPVVARTLQLAGSPIVTPLSTAVALVGWFLVVLAHVATTAYVTRAGVRGGLGTALLVAWLLQCGLGLADALAGEPVPALGGAAPKLFITAVIAVALFAYLWAIRSQSEPAAVLRP
jgi:hypothetical protein